MIENQVNATASTARLWTMPLLVASVCWMAFVSWRAIDAWPRLPLDIGGTDAATRAGLQGAVVQHTINAGLIAIAPPIVIFLVLRWLWPKRKPRT